MKVKKINLDNYEIEVQQQDGSYSKIPYDVKKSIGDIILAPPLKLNGTELLKNNLIAQKIIECKDSFILLEQNEYNVIRNAIDVLDMFGKHDVKLIKKIVDATDVEVEEKK